MLVGESFESLLGLLDEGPRVLAAPAERGSRRLGADQLHDPAIGKLEGLAVEHGGDGCLSGGGRSQARASVATSAAAKAAVAQKMPLSIRLAMTYLKVHKRGLPLPR